MLSYLHGFHAGNHADVLKHAVLLALLDALTAKQKPLRYVDTHSGAGGYDLRSSAAQKNREYEGGIGRVWEAADPPPPVARLLDLVRLYNRGGGLSRYPGSPWLARQALGANDTLFLYELHPAEHRALAAGMKGERRARVLRADGLTEVVGLVPPPERRALVFADPSYERQDEQRQVITAVAAAHRRFATGVYAIWYPLIERRAVDALERAVGAAALAPRALFELSIAPDSRGRGMTGSGMIVLNPPWRVREQIEGALPWLARALAGERGRYRVYER